MLTVTTAFLGTLFLSVAFVGYLFDRLGIFKRVCFAIGAFGLIAPGILGSIIALFLITPLFFLQLRKSKYSRLS